MSDIARLGLVVDSRPVADASKVLADFARAGKPAEDAANRIVAAMDRSKKPAQEMVKYTGLARHEMINLGRQVQDVGVSLVSGQSPFMVLAQQGAQIYDIFNSSQGSLRGFATQLRGMIGPTTLLVGGLVALGGVTYAAVSYWKSYALALDDLSKSTGVATIELSKLQSAAAIKGIGQDDFVAGMQRFAQSVYEAKAGTSELATLLRLNGQTVGDTARTFDTIANLVQRASGDTQKQFSILRSAGLPATMEFVRLLSSGEEGLRKAKAEAAGLGGTIDDAMVLKAREFDEAWNRSWENFKSWARRSVVDAASGLQGLVDQAANALVRLRENAGVGPIGTPADQIAFRFPTLSEQMKQEDRTKKDTVKDAQWLAQRQHEIQLEQQKISLLGETATATDRRREVELRLQAAGLSGVKLTETQIAKIREYADAERSLSEVRERLGILGAAATDAERYAARLQELSVALRRNKIDQEQFNRAVLEASPIYSGISASLESNITSGLTNFATGAKTAQAAFYEMTQAILRDIVQITIRMMILRPLMEGISGAGGVGGIVSTLFGAVNHTGYGPGDSFNETRLIPASTVASAPRFHSGVGPGERVAVLRDDESVLTPGQMRQLSPVGGGGGTTFAPTINVSMPPGSKPEDGARFGKEISRVIHAEVMDVLVRQKRAGGMLS